MSEKVNEMFSRLSGHYDLMNSVLSVGIDKLWRKKAVKYSAAKADSNVLDCAAGTGELSIEFKKAVGNGKVVAADFCRNMLDIADKKFHEANYDISISIEDILNLNYEDNCFDISSIAFGIRNVDSIERCLEEMARVVRPGGEVVVLELGQPLPGKFADVYEWYRKSVIPFLGKLMVNDKPAYNYLNVTASRFPSRENFTEIMRSTGKFDSIRYYPLTFGIAYVYIGEVK